MKDPSRARAAGRRLRSVARFAAVVLLVGTLPASALATTAARRRAVAPAPAQSRPNIVLILTDDQRWDSLWAMPNVQRLLVDRGVSFTRAFAENPLCCPSRASILTGRPSNSTGVWTNTPPYGGFDAFDDRSTIATWLDASGYRTALIGKYLNHYGEAAREGYVPPGWDRWVAFAQGDGRYYDYDLTIDGAIRHFGRDPEDYSTDVMSRYAVSFIRHTRKPLFLYLAPNAPHDPYTPAPQDVGAFADLPPAEPPAYGEADVSDKPPYVQAKGWSKRASVNIQDVRRKQLETLLAVDRAVADVVQALEETGRLSNSIIVFTSDNGYMHGEHRLMGKQVPYEESIRVPLVVRDDALTAGATAVNRFALNIDLAPTFAAAARVDAPGAEGQSLLPLLTGEPTGWRTRFLIEHYRGERSIVPSFCGVRADQWSYVLYQDGFEELYDLALDPAQLTNLADVPGHSSLLSGFRSWTERQCEPRPPDWGS